MYTGGRSAKDEGAKGESRHVFEQGQEEEVEQGQGQGEIQHDGPLRQERHPLVTLQSDSQYISTGTAHNRLQRALPGLHMPR